MFWMLVRTRWKEISRDATWLIIASLILPAGLLLGLSWYLPAGEVEPEQTLIASLLLPPLGLGIMQLPDITGKLRERHVVSFYGSFPLRLSVFLLANVCLYWLASLPGIILTPLSVLVRYTSLAGLLIALLPVALLGQAYLILLGLATGWLLRRQAPAAVVANIAYFSMLLGTPVLLVQPQVPPFWAAARECLPSMQLYHLFRWVAGHQALPEFSLLLMLVYSALAVYGIWKTARWTE